MVRLRDAVKELRAAVSATEIPLLRYYGEMFLGRALSLRQDADGRDDRGVSFEVTMRGLGLLGVLGCLGLGPWALSLVAQTPTFSAKLDVVRVDALVTDGGRIVSGLGPADFEVLDNGVSQQVDLASFEELPLNVVLALDMSDSVSGERLGHLRDAGRAVLGGLKGADQAGLLTFSHRLTLRQDLTRDLQRLRTALDDAEPRGQTSLIDGTYAAMLLGEADAGRDLLIVFSDGVDTASWLTPESVLESARRSEVTVYGVSVRGGRRDEFLEDIAEATGGDVIEIESTKDLGRTFLRILEEFRQRYVVSYSPRGVSKDGWHKLQVRVKGRRATVKARTGYFGG